VHGGHETYWDMWHAGYGDRFFDMGTLVRLGTAIETGLRQFHTQHGGTAPDRGFYQRIVSEADAKKFEVRIQADCDYDLGQNNEWPAMRVLMAHRHLYAHRGGSADAGYIKTIESLTGIDIEPELQAIGYPHDEVYWFTPLASLNIDIENTRRFFSHLPDA
jgi:hypothetical protein